MADLNIGGMAAIHPFQFHHNNKKKYLLKTTKMSKLTTDKAIKLLLEVAASSAELIQRWDPSVLTVDLNIGGMAAILPFEKFHHKKKHFS